MLPRPGRSFKSTHHITLINPITTPHQKRAHETNIQNQTFPLKLMLTSKNKGRFTQPLRYQFLAH